MGGVKAKAKTQTEVSPVSKDKKNSNGAQLPSENCPARIKQQREWGSSYVRGAAVGAGVGVDV